MVSRLALAIALVIPLGARAEPRAPRPPAVHHDVWRDMLWPHKDEVDQILQRVKVGMAQADLGLSGDDDPTGEERAQLYRKVYAMLRYAQRLAPDNTDVLRLLAQTSDELGKTNEALAALRAIVDQVGPDKAGAEVDGMLGAIYLRLGKLDDAIYYLRLAQGPLGAPGSAQRLVHLSIALALRGETSDAIDVLANALPPTVSYYSNEVALASFALAVQYDRDEQRGAAFEVLDHLQTVLQGQYGAQLQNPLAAMRYAPAEDRYYFLALFYESMGNFAEARAQWALYAACPGAPYRARALDHIEEIDAQRSSPAARRGRLPPNGVGSSLPVVPVTP